MKQIVRIYYKSDWSIAIKLPNGYDNENFIIRLFTTDSYNYFEAKYLDGVYTHCTVDTEENTVIIYVDDHKLNAGCLHVMQAYDYDNNHFADGVETLATIEDSNIYLVKNNPNSTSAMFIGSALPDLTGVSDYVTKSDLAAASYATTSYVAEYVAQYAPTPDLSSYVTKTELNNAGYITQETLIEASYVTQDALSSMGYITTIPEEYVTQNELNTALNGYVTNDALSQASYVTEQALSQASYATQSYVAEYVTEHGGDIDLSAYVTKTELNNAGYITQETVSQASYVTSNALSSMGYITTIPEEYITQNELNAMGYLTEHQDLSSYVSHAELNSASYATKTYVADYVSQHAPTPDLSAYVTKTELENAGYITSIPSEYVTDSELSSMGYITSIPSEYVTDSELSSMGYITSIPSEYITESEISQAGYATKTYVSDYVATYGGNVDLSAYVTKTELNNAGYITSIPSEYITESELSSMGYITSIPSEYITESEISQAGYATKTYVADYVAQHAPTPDFSAYVTKTELNNAGYITSIPSEYVTESELSAMGYITSIPSEYITDSELSSMSYATQTYVADYVAQHGGGSGGASVYSVTYAEYQELINTGTYDPYTLYLITDGTPVDTSTFATQAYVVEYVATYAPTPDLSAYVTKTELDNAGYISSIPSEYVTESEIASMSYATQAYVADYVAAYAPTPDLSAYVTKTELDNASYTTTYECTQVEYDYMVDHGLTYENTLYVITDAVVADLTYFATQAYVVEYVATYAPTPDLSAYVTKTELDAASYTTVIELTSQEYDILSYDAKHNGAIYVLTDATDITYYATEDDLNAYVSKTELSAASYLTYANFIYDSTTNTLTISI